jgi:hypothetical protein
MTRNCIKSNSASLQELQLLRLVHLVEQILYALFSFPRTCKLRQYILREIRPRIETSERRFTRHILLESLSLSLSLSLFSPPPLFLTTHCPSPRYHSFRSCISVSVSHMLFLTFLFLCYSHQLLFTFLFTFIDI